MSLNVKDYKTLSVDYILKHGVNSDKDKSLQKDYVRIPERGIRWCMYRTVPDGSETPFTGVVYNAITILTNNPVNTYDVYKDGLLLYGGEYSRTYRGVLSEYHEDAPFKQVFFHRNGRVKSIYNARPDCHHFYEKMEFDENGRVTKRKLLGEIRLEIVPGSPESRRYDMKFYNDTGYFKSIRIKEPTRNELYSYVEYDRENVPTAVEINPGFDPDYFSIDPERNPFLDHVKVIDDSFRVKDGILEHSLMLEHGFTDRDPHFSKFSGEIKYLREDGSVRSIYHYSGVRRGDQKEYYPNGNIKEYYYISYESEEICSDPLRSSHFKWDEDGRLAEVTVYAYDYSGRVLKHWKRGEQ